MVKRHKGHEAEEDIRRVAAISNGTGHRAANSQQ